MADKFKFYTICPVCNGTGILGIGNDTPGESDGERTCPRCADETGPFGAKVFDGLRHVYSGRFEEVEDD